MAVGDFRSDLGCGYWVAMAQFKIGYRRKAIGYFQTRRRMNKRGASIRLAPHLLLKQFGGSGAFLRRSLYIQQRTFSCRAELVAMGPGCVKKASYRHCAENTAGICALRRNFFWNPFSERPGRSLGRLLALI